MKWYIFIVRGRQGTADVSILQVSMLKLAWSLTHTEPILQGSYSLFGEATESAQDPLDGALVVIPQLPLQHRG